MLANSALDRSPMAYESAHPDEGAIPKQLSDSVSDVPSNYRMNLTALRAARYPGRYANFMSHP